LKTKRVLLKITFTLLLQLGVWGICSGQVAILLFLFGDQLASEELHLSVDGAINISNISNIDQGSTFYGLNFGLGLHAKLSNRWQLNPQFRPLSQKGARNTLPLVDLPTEFSEHKTKVKLNYIEIPVMIRYSVTPDFFIAIGPQISFLTSANQFTDGSYNNGSDATLRINVQKFFKIIDYSFPVEAGYWLELKSKNSSSTMNVNLFARYCPGLMSINKNDNSGMDSKVSTFQIGVSFPFIKTQASIQ